MRGHFTELIRNMVAHLELGSYSRTAITLERK
jgi:hypothetical protein